MEKKNVLILTSIGLVFLCLITFLIFQDIKRKEITKIIEQNYTGYNRINGIMVDNNCGIEDPVVIKITEYLKDMTQTESVLKQVANPSEDDVYHQFLINNVENYDQHTYWLYPDGFEGFLFHQIDGEPRVIKIFLTH